MTRHAADLLSLTFGVLFASIGLVLLLGDLSRLSLEWLAPLVAIALGIVVVLAARSTRGTTPEEPSEG